MALPYVVAVGTVASGTGSITPALPVGWAQNDILILAVETANQAFTTWPPTGWTEVSNPPTGFGSAGLAGGLRLLVAYKRAGASESAPVLGDSGNHQVARITAVRGVVTAGNPWVATATSNYTTATSSVTWPSLTSTTNDSLYVYVLGGDRDAASTADVSSLNNASGNTTGVTSQLQNWVTAGAGGGIFLGTGDVLLAGISGTTTATLTTQVASIWSGILAPEKWAVYADTPAQVYQVITSVESDLSPVYGLYSSTPNAWFTSLTGGDETWAERYATAPQSYSVYEDVVLEYQLYTYESLGYHLAWTPRLDGTYNTWFDSYMADGGLTPVTSDSSTVTYSVKGSVYSDTSGIVYQIASSTGLIHGSAELPSFTAESDAILVYGVKSTAQSDVTPSYIVHTSADADILVSYIVRTAVSQDQVVTYTSGGYVQEDSGATYKITAGVEQDLVPVYKITQSVSEDLGCIFNLITVPLTASEVAVFEYNVVKGVEQDTSYTYRVLNSAELDSPTVTYDVLLEAEKDLVVLYEVAGQVSSTQTVTYQVNGIISANSDLFIRYNIGGLSSQIPNVVGYHLSKAKRTLQRAGFSVGTITYN